MRRTASDKRPNVKPVQKIELSQKNIKRRIIFVALFLILGIVAIGYGISGFLTKSSDWVEVEVDAADEKHCGDDFKFFYKLGQGEESATTEYKQVRKLYIDTCVDAYNLFQNSEDIAGIRSVYFINQHPNTEIKVEKALYDAFVTINNYNNRNLFLAPIYEQYDDIFLCTNDGETVDYDPYQNEEVAKEYLQLAEYARDNDSVSIELLDDCTIMLKVSKEYESYAKDNNVRSYIDFSWMKNAFIADYIADTMIDNGYSFGTITSFDGYTRTFLPDSESSNFSANGIIDNTIYPVASGQYNGSMSSVVLRGFRTTEKDKYSYYTFSGGSTRTMFVDTLDGKCRNSIDELMLYSREKKCGEILMEMIPSYIADSFEDNQVLSLAKKEIFALYCKDKVIYYNNSDIELSNIYKSDDIEFTVSYVD